MQILWKTVEKTQQERNLIQYVKAQGGILQQVPVNMS